MADNRKTSNNYKADGRTSIFLRKSVGGFVIQFLVAAITAIAVWALLDWLFDCVMGGKEFTFTINRNIITPVVLALILIIIDFVFWDKFHKK